ncbi:hypothetical protein [Oryza sativa Japonica Group]|uniref:Uncharacterized protein B1046G12.1 n=1 Tax=Oryza sativa subsp. japonica TaxID=39947 RepID=Q5QMN0_ORYSJ|nr:hypothetical protein [Oryza sativa Japonica Group]BAD73321.1 hypothetical protein [Oryza sativa Japonica Group]
MAALRMATEEWRAMLGRWRWRAEAEVARTPMAHSHKARTAVGVWAPVARVRRAVGVRAVVECGEDAAAAGGVEEGVGGRGRQDSDVTVMATDVDDIYGRKCIMHLLTGDDVDVPFFTLLP